jgi:hypothetical protein
MLTRYVEGRSGSGARPTRCGATPSCSPLWERYRHEYSTSDVRPRRRFYDHPERAGAGFIPPDRPNHRRAGARPAGRLGRRLRPVGPVAQAQGAHVRPGGAGTGRRGLELLRWLGGHGGPLRPCDGLRPHGRLHRPGHVAGTARSLGGDPHGPAMAGHPAAGGSGPGRTGAGHGSGPAARDGGRPSRTGSTGFLPTYDHGQTAGGRQGPHRRAAGVAALPHPHTPGRPAGPSGD